MGAVDLINARPYIEYVSIDAVGIVVEDIARLGIKRLCQLAEPLRGQRALFVFQERDNGLGRADPIGQFFLRQAAELAPRA